jgi:hypothetical protein
MSSNLTFSYADFLMKSSYSVRSVFYLLTPTETYYAKQEDVPDLSVNAFNVMMSFIFFEQLIFLAKHGRFSGRINDSVFELLFFYFSGL